MSPRLAVLMFHDIVPEGATGYAVEVGRLERILETCLSPDGVETEITFDDGREGTFRHGLPVLHRLGLRSTLFVTTDFLGRPGFMDAPMLSEWAAAGQSVGSHAVTHRPLSVLGEEEARDELGRSREVLERVVGSKIDTFAFPGGNDHARLHAWAAEAGYERVYTSEPGFARKGDSVLPRFAIRASTPPESISALRRGNTPAAFRLDRAMWRLKRVIGARAYVAIRRGLRR